MKTNHVKNIVLLLLVVQLFAACSKDFLNTTPTDNLALSTFWKTPANADQGLTQLYSYFYSYGGGYSVTYYTPLAWDTFSDDCFGQYDYGGGLTALTSGITPQSGGFIGGFYGAAYQQIASANSFLANVDKVLTGDQAKAYKAEAYFIRGMNYAMLAQLYANVPIVTQDPLTIDPKTRLATSPQVDVFKLAESDFDLAIAGLPDIAYGSGHAVKTTAQGYKVRLLMFQHRYAEAALLANEIIQGKKYSLSTNYLGNFYRSGQNTSPEIMFSVKYQLPTLFLNPDINQVISQYKGYLGTQDLVNEFEPGDPRKKMNLFFDGDTRADGWNLTGFGGVARPGQDQWIPGFYPIHKWIEPTTLDPFGGSKNDAAFVLLRYADILLMYAEAQNEASGPDNTVYAAVNAVRARQGVNMPALAVGLSQTDMRTKIRHERRVEFPMEGLRFYDLKRWGITVQKLDGFVQNPLSPNIKTKYKVLYDIWPIPQAEIDRNAPVMKQNTGY